MNDLCRPLNNDEKSSRSSAVVSVPGKREVSVHSAKYTNPTYTFDRVFDDKSKQKDIYKTVVHPMIDQVMQGYNCTVFAYGQTGTGKTYTMEGMSDEYEGAWEKDPNAGIIPRYSTLICFEVALNLSWLSNGCVTRER